MSWSWIENEIRENFSRARRRAFLNRMIARLNRTSNDLLPLNEVRSRIRVRGQHFLGLQSIPVQQIVGSEGRYTDFDRQFLPLRASLKERWLSIDRAHFEDVNLPPVDLYKMGQIYFVRDGNHRVSVARQQGQEFIDAYVTELDIEVPLSTNLSVHDLLLKEEYSDFLEWTNLRHLRRDAEIEFSELGGYLTLVTHINAHRYYMGLDYGREASIEEAVVDWYDHVYMPVVQVIREQRVLAAFPGRTEADLYRWVMDHRWYLRERNNGTDPGPHTATLDYVEHFGARGCAR
ncbi:MAG: DUF4032 domain-containing protein [Chloroflexaceae bacterium]|nr:DUF4032 domain-containing protein [Chloroflexaceae bacterium]